MKIIIPTTKVVAEGLIENQIGDLIWWVSVPNKHTGPGYTAAFHTPERGLVVRKSNFGGTNVADHLRWLDGSTSEAVKARLERERFLFYFEHEFNMRIKKPDNEDSSE